MAKSKSKKGFRAKHSSSGAAPVNYRDSRVKAIQTWDDTANDLGEDAFDANRDKVMLDDFNERDDDYDLDDSNEVLGLKPLKHKAVQQSDEDQSEDEEPVQRVKPKRKQPAKDHIPLTNGKISRYDRPEQAEASSSGSGSSESDESEEEEKWSAAAYHVSRKERERGSPVAETRAEQRELAQAELDEALRLQRLARSKLRVEDFGDYDRMEKVYRQSLQESQEAVHAVRKEISFELPSSAKVVQQPAPSFASREEAIAHLLSTKPELLSLLHDFYDLSMSLPEVDARHKTLLMMHTKMDEPMHPSVGLSKLHLDLMQGYLVVATFWFKLMLDGPSSEDLADQVLKRLVDLREGLQTLETEGIGGLDDDEELEEGEGRERLSMLDLLSANAEEAADMARLMELDGREDSEEDGDEDEETESEEEEEVEEEEEPIPVPIKSKKANGKAKAVEPNKKRTKVTIAEPDSTSFEREYDQLLAQSLSSKQKRATAAQLNGGVDDLVEAPSLAAADADDRKSKKHTLRFHTSQINAKANRRAAAVFGQRSAGGDDDVPYKSKEMQRREAQRKESAKQAKEMAALENAKSQTRQNGIAKDKDDVEMDEDGRDGYYDLILNAGKAKGAKEEAKKQAYDEARLQDRAALAEVEATAGPRSVSRAILANKGLTPKRAKVNRNPRVKKRMQYEKAQKKVSSMKSIYKDDKAIKGKRDYRGEGSGINTKVVKSRKL